MTKKVTAPAKNPGKPGPKGSRETKAKRRAGTTAKGRMVAANGLNPSQVRVLGSLLRGESRAQAAEAGGCSLQGVQYMLGIPAFKAAFEHALALLQAHSQLDAQAVIHELLPALRTDIREFYDADGVFKPMDQWTEAMGKSVAGIEFEEIWEGQGKDRRPVGTLTKLKFWPKTEAADKIARILGLFAPEKKQVSGFVGVVVVPAKTPAPETIAQQIANRVVSEQ